MISVSSVCFEKMLLAFARIASRKITKDKDYKEGLMTTNP